MASNPADDTVYSGYSGSATGPLPLVEAIRQLPNQYFRVLTKPSAETFTQEKGKAAWDIVGVQLLIQLLSYTIISAILGFLLSLFTKFSSAFIVTSLGVPDELVPRGLLATLASILIPSLIFLAATGTIHTIARFLGGQGRFVEQCYALLLFQVPITILANLLWLVPYAVPYAFPALSVYSVILLFLSIMGVQNLSTGRAVATLLASVVVIPIVVGILIRFLAIGFFPIF
jgi:hypothetical protein